MTGKNLHFSQDLDLPADEFIESKSAILGQSGTGKSGLLKVLEEELIEAGRAFIAFDPAGIMWGLRSSKNGKSYGLDVLVIGGEHADIELNRNAGADVARMVVEMNFSVVIDLSDETKGTYQKFLAEFCEELYVAQGKSRTPRLVIIDEAHEILPQDVRNDQATAFAAARKIVTRGRNRGLGVCLVSQRPAGIAKSVLTQCGSLFLFGVLGTPDLKAIKDWVGAWGASKELGQFEEGLSSLRTQECWFWSPREFGKFKKIRVRDFTTYHPDYTHLRRAGLLDSKPVMTNLEAIVSELRKKMSTIVQERVDVADVPRLRSRLTQLEAQLKVANERAKPIPPKAIPVIDHVKMDRVVAKEVERAVGPYRKALTTANRQLTMLSEMGGKIAAVKTVDEPNYVVSPPDLKEIPSEHPASNRTQHERAWAPTQATADRLSRVPMPTPATQAPEDGSTPQLLAGPRRMLAALDRVFPNGLTREQIGILSGMTPSGSFSTYMGNLTGPGFIVRDSSGLYVITEEGRAQRGDEKALETHEEVVRAWDRKLLAGPRRMLAVIIAARGVGIERHLIAEKAGMTLSGSFSTYMGNLTGNYLVERKGTLYFPSETLWP